MFYSSHSSFVPGKSVSAIRCISALCWLLLLHTASCLANPKETIHVVGEPSLTYYAADERADFGVATGMDALFLTHLLESLGYEVKVDVLPWSRAYQLALDKPNTLIHSIARNEKREALFHWVEAYMELEYGLYSFGDAVRFNIASTEDLHQYTLAAQREDRLYFQLQKLGLKRIKTVLHYNMLFSLLEKGRVDLIHASRENTRIRCQQLEICEKLLLEYSLSHINGTLYFAFNKQTDMGIVKQVRRAFHQKVNSGEYLHLFPQRRVELKMLQ